MGLDVYLYRYEDREATLAKEDAYEAFSNTTWQRIQAGREYDALSEAEKESARATTEAYAAEHGLDKWGDDAAGKAQVEIPSAKYPDHMFKIGYFRSSYNRGGINHILYDRTGKDLGWVFFGENERDDYVVAPDWSASLERARMVLADLQAWRAQNGDVRVERASAAALRVDSVAVDEADALARYLAERAKHTKGRGFDSYTSALGLFDFSEDPSPVRAVIVGRPQFGGPCVYLIRDGDSDCDLGWYEQALEIVIETIEWVLSRPDSGKYALHWSS